MHVINSVSYSLTLIDLLRYQSNANEFVSLSSVHHRAIIYFLEIVLLYLYLKFCIQVLIEQLNIIIRTMIILSS